LLEKAKRKGPVGWPRKWWDNSMKIDLRENFERMQAGLTPSWEQVAGSCKHAKEFGSNKMSGIS